jgi:hypothetical protein
MQLLLIFFKRVMYLIANRSLCTNKGLLSPLLICSEIVFNSSLLLRMNEYSRVKMDKDMPARAKWKFHKSYKQLFTIDVSINYSCSLLK